MTTREDFIQAAGGQTAAVEFEGQCLSIGRGLLPECARLVLDGAEGTEEYWTWLIEQLNG